MLGFSSLCIVVSGACNVNDLSSKSSSAVDVLKYNWKSAVLGLFALKRTLRPTASSSSVTTFVKCLAAALPPLGLVSFIKA